MNVSDDLILAHRLQTGNGWSFTLASRLGELLRSAERQFGPRDTTYTPLGIEFAADGPRTWYPEDCRHVIIQLGSICATNEVRALYQLAHESIHLLSPTGVPDSSNILEEGLATVFSYRFIHETFGLDWTRSGDPRYDSAAAAVEKLLAIDAASILRLRVHQQTISRIDAHLILAQYPAVGADLANELAHRFK